jgi:hypothetical protein
MVRASMPEAAARSERDGSVAIMGRLDINQSDMSI